MTSKKRKRGAGRRRGITPWKKTVLRFAVLLLLAAAGLHAFRYIKAAGFEDQQEAARWGGEIRSAQVSAFLPARDALKEEDILELEYKIHTALTQDSIKLTAEGPDARLWQDCYSGIGNLTLRAGSKTVDVEAVGTGGAFFTFHPVKIVSGSYYSSDSLMKDEILLDEETAWKLFGAFDVEGRTLQVEDMHLRIAGVYRNEKDKLYERAGLADYVVFVQYKTLLQYGGGDAGTQVPAGTESGAQGLQGAAPRTAVSRGAGSVQQAAVLRRASGAQVTQAAGGGFAPRTATAASEGEVQVEMSDGSDGSGGADAAGADGAGTGTGADTGAAAASSGADSGTGTGAAGSSGTGTGAAGSSGTGTGAAGGNGTDGAAEEVTGSSPSGTTGENTQNMENVGTSNTAFKDTGKITTFEIVMPDPVEGYAAATLKKALGEDSEAVIVDNTNRFGERSLLADIRDFAFLGMRTQAVQYPSWENVAMGWQTIFAALLLLEILLIVIVILLLVWLLVHWYRHRGWTVASRLNDLQESVYERQSRRRYPEYYEEETDPNTEEENSYVEEDDAEVDDAASGAIRKDDEPKELLEDKGAIPFERLHADREKVPSERADKTEEPKVRKAD